MTNYAKLGEYTAFKKQAQDAAERRRTCLAMLERKAEKLKRFQSDSIDRDELTQLIDDAVKAEKEMRAAMDVANQAALLCGEDELDLIFLLKV